MTNTTINLLDNQIQKEHVFSLMNKCLISEYKTDKSNSEIETLINYYFENYQNTIFVMDYDQEFCGFAWLTENFDPVIGTPFYLFMYLAIEKKFRGKSLSKKLMKYALDFCKETPVKEVKLTVDVNNKNAIKLYEYFGFENYKYEMKLNL